LTPPPPPPNPHLVPPPPQHISHTLHSLLVTLHESVQLWAVVANNQQLPVLIVLQGKIRTTQKSIGKSTVCHTLNEGGGCDHHVND
jgi:hypothetical protein